MFDRQVTQAMAEGDFLQFLTMDPAFCEQAAECGLRSFQIMAGALDGLVVEAKLLSYEDVTGVGYGVATFTVTEPDENRHFGEQCAELELTRLAEKKATEDPLGQAGPVVLGDLCENRRAAGATAGGTACRDD